MCLKPFIHGPMEVHKWNIHLLVYIMVIKCWMTGSEENWPGWTPVQTVWSLHTAHGCAHHRSSCLIFSLQHKKSETVITAGLKVMLFTGQWLKSWACNCIQSHKRRSVMCCICYTSYVIVTHCAGVNPSVWRELKRTRLVSLHYCVRPTLHLWSAIFMLSVKVAPLKCTQGQENTVAPVAGRKFKDPSVMGILKSLNLITSKCYSHK